MRSSILMIMIIENLFKNESILLLELYLFHTCIYIEYGQTKVQNYNSAELYATRTEDEDGNASFEFKGRIDTTYSTNSRQQRAP